MSRYRNGTGPLQHKKDVMELHDAAYVSSLNILALMGSYLERYPERPDNLPDIELADAMLYMVMKEAATLRDTLRELGTAYSRAQAARDDD